MKKIILILSSILCLILCFGAIILYVDDSSFSPLKEKEIQKLFPNYRGTFKKKCDVDFIGMNFKGEWFEVYLYKVDAIPVDLNYPKYNGIWERKSITEEVITSKWINCPLDSATRKLYEFNLMLEIFDKKECIKSFNLELNNSENYYSYICFDELDQYFLLYCPSIGNLYYIRKKF